MQRLILALSLAILLAGPGVAAAQSTPPVVGNLFDPRGTNPLDKDFRNMTGMALGAGGALLAVNVITGGALLTPVVGPGVSAVISGAAVGIPSIPPAMTGELFRLVSILALTATGGYLGYWWSHPATAAVH